VENTHLPLERHDYSFSKRAAVYGFFGHHLRLDLRNLPYGDGYVEDFVEVLPAEELRVWTEEAPRPSGALLGDEAVMGYLGIYGYGKG